MLWESPDSKAIVLFHQNRTICIQVIIGREKALFDKRNKFRKIQIRANLAQLCKSKLWCKNDTAWWQKYFSVKCWCKNYFASGGKSIFQSNFGLIMTLSLVAKVFFSKFLVIQDIGASTAGVVMASRKVKQDNYCSTS